MREATSQHETVSTKRQAFLAILRPSGGIVFANQMTDAAIRWEAKGKSVVAHEAMFYRLPSSCWAVCVRLDVRRKCQDFHAICFYCGWGRRGGASFAEAGRAITRQLDKTQLTVAATWQLYDRQEARCLIERTQTRHAVLARAYHYFYTATQQLATCGVGGLQAMPRDQMEPHAATPPTRHTPQVRAHLAR